MVYIYVLKLENNKYYIGKTKNMSFRLESHFNAEGSFWTKKYKPIELLEIFPNCDNYDEDKYTIKYMEKYGITNVRGGSFCEIRLSENNLLTLKQMIATASDKCFICGLPGHYAKECKNNKTNLKIPTINLNDKCTCPTSYFSPHRKGKCLLNKILTYFDDENEDIDLIRDNFNKTQKICNRCGRNSHYTNECYAKTNKYGDSL
jgi:predicted GIY-YIG superfamily endonuclease